MEENIASLTSNKKEDDKAYECNKFVENSQWKNDELERKHFQRVLNAFKNYERGASERLEGALARLERLPHRARLAGHREHLQALLRAVRHNQRVLDALVREARHLFHDAPPTEDEVEGAEVGGDLEKVEGVLRQVWREWSAEGAAEREAAFDPILRHIQEAFPHAHRRAEVRVLVPGAGLGRLAWEVARRGFSCQGNELSLFMLIAANFVLNKCRGAGEHEVFPWVWPLHNRLRPCHALVPAPFPDVDPSDLPPSAAFSMAAGAFPDIYAHHPGSWECVLTCFFVDTAADVSEYVDAVWAALVPGGLWLNLGPLLYHGAEALALSWEELRRLIADRGFLFTHEEEGVRTPYAQDPRSMMVHEYRSVFFACTKPHEL